MDAPKSITKADIIGRVGEDGYVRITGIWKSKHPCCICFGRLHNMYHDFSHVYDKGLEPYVCCSCFMFNWSKNHADFVNTSTICENCFPT